MPYFLSEQALSIGQVFTIDGGEARHILLSRRAKVGEQLKVQGPDGKRFLAEIKEIDRNLLKLMVLEEIPVPAEPSIKITLFQSVVASGTLDTILQKATELGAAELVLFNSQFTATKLSPEKFAEKLPRFQKIVWEAAKQSERVRPPVVSFADGLNGVIGKSAGLDKLLVFDIAGSNLKSEISNLKSVGVVIGPEGGLSPEEISQFQSISNCQLVSLGLTLLKADTAAVASLAIVNNQRI